MDEDDNEALLMSARQARSMLINTETIFLRLQLSHLHAGPSTGKGIMLASKRTGR